MYRPSLYATAAALALAIPAVNAAHAPPAKAHPPKAATHQAAPPPARAPHTVTRTGKSRAGHGPHAHGVQAHRGPPPPAWTIRPRHHQTAVAAEGYSDGDPTPWNARWGCASTATPAGNILTAIGVADPELRRLFSLSDVDAHAGETGCVPYAVVTGDANEVLALALVAAEGASATPALITFSRESADDPFTLRTAAWPPSTSGISIATLEVGDAIARNGTAEALPPDLRFEVSALARTMLQEMDLPDPDAVRVRVAFQAGVEREGDRLLSIELLEPTTSRLLKQTLWVPREGVPGGYFTPNGESLEPLFWTNPVNFRYISRGVGTAATRARREAARTPSHRVAAARKPRHAMHIGVDFVAPAGTPAIAVSDGTVLFMGYFGGYGNLVIVQHAGGYTSHYGHLSAFASGMAVGTVIRRGATLGYVGATGLATGPHLHFEIRHEGSYVDPLDQSAPMTLWSLRRVDYAPLLRQLLTTGALIAARPDPSPTTSNSPPSAQAGH
jgi:murein DD-endopeptidase MepM/ murein hydrolase activator NlpD